MNKLQIKLLFFIILSLLINQGCIYILPGCKLNIDDKEWLSEEYENLNYFLNRKDTIILPVKTSFDQSEIQYHDIFRFPEGDKNHYGVSWLRFPLNTSDTLRVKLWVEACNSKIKLTTAVYNNSHSSGPFFEIYKDSLTDLSLNINDKIYENCFQFTDEEDSLFKELVLVKGYGVVKLSTYEGDVFELISDK